MKKTFYSTLILLAAVVLSSCDGTSEGYKKNSHKSLVKEAIDKNIQEMGEKPWDKNAYTDILYNQINSFKGTLNAKESLKKSLDFTYGKVLVRDANDILDHCAKDKHERLNRILNEIVNFPNAEGLTELTSKIKKHKEMMDFVSSMYEKQSVNNISISYDKNFEETKKNRAETYLAENPTCTYIKKNLSSTKSIFDQRRKKYATALVALYCKGTGYDSNIELSVKGKINDALRGVKDVDTFKNDLLEKMKRFKEIFITNSKL